MKKHIMPIFFALIIGLALIPCGCSDDSSEPALSMEDTFQVYGIVSMVMTQSLSTAYSTDKGPLTDIITANDSAALYPGCTISWNLKIDSTTGTIDYYTITITFDDYSSQGITLNGTSTLDMDGNISNYSIEPFSQTSEASIDVSGSFSGTVEWDYTMTIDESQTCFSGTFGGYEFVDMLGYECIDTGSL